MSSLRVFTSRKKNFYFIRVDKGPLLVRASFYYGNYDRTLSPPSFDLLIDGNHRTKVITSLDQLVCYEVVYVVESDATSICLAQTQPDQFPFISALESHILSRSSYNLWIIIRCPDDVYDRIWVPYPMKLMYQKILRKPSCRMPLQPQACLKKRSFMIYIDNNPKSEPVIPPYGKVTEMLINYTASSNTSFSLVSTLDSTLPPLINAMEVFSVSDPLVVGTNSKDVGGLVDLQTQFSVLQGRYGDPCLPSPYTWDWISCSNDVIPHVTALDLSSFGLSGQLPDFSSMDSLVAMCDLHNNSLSGPIPDFLGAFPYLEELVSGNPGLCVSSKSCKPTSTDGSKSSPTPSSSSEKSNKLPIILGTTIPSSMISSAIVAFILHHRRKKAAIAAITAGQAAGSNIDDGCLICC
ncbi:LRR receptor-like serine/threonine-protein kinase [Populus alba x Populus x berolinensis]|uniref:LRR receptor-like serine/threonine-protein kinase n=1 Tax=Populus alba x Populus x berolinensis TaxID=444605 RepID=A0AAD6Q0C6_9ROSI|nr:LRR receptor-like serine/threonine-protein kinase [Populus alba x Populus x berolinensis]